MEQDDIPIATKHAYDRAKERLRWKKSTLDRMMVKAFEDGITHGDTTGSLNKYITRMWEKNKSANNIRIYGENIYFFCNNRLVTIYRVPNSLVKYIKNFK